MSFPGNLRDLIALPTLSGGVTLSVPIPEHGHETPTGQTTPIAFTPPTSIMPRSVNVSPRSDVGGINNSGTMVCDLACDSAGANEQDHESMIGQKTSSCADPRP